MGRGARRRLLVAAIAARVYASMKRGRRAPAAPKPSGGPGRIPLVEIGWLVQSHGRIATALRNCFPSPLTCPATSAPPFISATANGGPRFKRPIESSPSFSASDHALPKDGGSHRQSAALRPPSRATCCARGARTPASRRPAPKNTVFPPFPRRICEPLGAAPPS